MQGHREAALLLVQRGAPNLIRDARGRTPLEIAAATGSGSGSLKAELLAEAARGTRCAACGAGGKLKQCSRCVVLWGGLPAGKLGCAQAQLL